MNTISSSIIAAYKNDKETKPFEINNNREFISFIISFKYLGSILDIILDNIIDIRTLIKNTTKEIGILQLIQDMKKASVKIKIKLFLAIPINLVLQNTKIQLGNKADS